MNLPSLRARFQPIRLLAMDVDGVLTRGEITWGQAADGSLTELKSFNVRDGLGFGLVHSVGLHSAWITGRNSAIVLKRARELGVGEVCQGARDKRQALTQIAAQLGLVQEEVLYVGDDLNDLPAFEAAGVRIAVADAAPELRARADWVTEATGGCGAVREVMDAVLHAQERHQAAVAAFLERLRVEQRNSTG